jgi:hypothetical protein
LLGNAGIALDEFGKRSSPLRAIAAIAPQLINLISC